MNLQTLVLLVLTAAPSASATFLATPKRQISQLRDGYDFIIIGGGTAGLTVADRLTEAFPNRTVLVVEYGDHEFAPKFTGPPDDPPWASFWTLRSLPIAALNNRSASVRLGKVLGGGTAVNGQFFDRGTRLDYDAWAQAASPEFDNLTDKWDWDTLLPYFRKSVTFTQPSAEDAAKYGYTWDIPAAFGGSGPIDVTLPPFQWPIHKSSYNAWAEAGVAEIQECASGVKVGNCWVPSSQSPMTAQRSYAATGHYEKVIGSRKNYDVLFRHQVTKLEFTDGKSKPPAVRLRQVDANGTALVKARLEVILSAGAVHSPQILQRSGIGPSAFLKEAGIDVLLDLPGVGSNFQDHPGIELSPRVGKMPSPSPSTFTSNTTYQKEAVALFALRPAKGPYTLSGGNNAVYLGLPNITANHTQIVDSIRNDLASGAWETYLPHTYDSTLKAGYKAQLQILISYIASPNNPIFETFWSGGPSNLGFLHKPLSRGTVRLNMSDPDGDPIMDYRTVSNPVDMDMLATFVPLFRKYFNTPTMKALAVKELQPGPSVQSPEDIVGFLRGNINPTEMHPCCTTSMLPLSKGGVVGPDLKVYGLGRLRVVDAGVIPIIPSSHLMSTVYAVAEKASEIIIKEWTGQ